MTLGEAVHSFIQWPKKFITLVAPSPPPRPLSPVRDGSDFSFRASQKGKSSSAPHEQQQVSSKTSQQSAKTSPLRKRKANKQKDKSKEVKEEHLSNTYVLGELLVSKKALEQLGWASTILHDLYLKRFREEKHLSPCFSVKYQRQHFLQPAGHFLVTFEDLFLIYRLDKLNVGLLGC